jgi:hypothetical protein
LYLVIQQPATLWTAQINGAPAGTAGDLVADLTVDNGGAAVDLLDGMTVIIGSTVGARDKGVFYVRGDQTVGAATVALDIGSSSEIVDNVADDDHVTVLEEFRLNTRYPRVTEAAGVLTFYKDYDLLYSALGGNAAARRQASLPPVPVMGPPRVAFVELDGNVTFDFDWSDSYATYPAATVNAWDSDGIRGTTSGDWASALQDPPAQTYDGSSIDANNDISGLAGYRVWLELGTDLQDPPVQYRRGVRYVFTLRRPGQTVAGIDPTNAEPIVDFNLDSLSGSFNEGGWEAAITVFGSQADEAEIIPGSMVIVFSEDWYGGTQEEIGPIEGSENVLFVGNIADDSIQIDSETGDTTFDVLGYAGMARNREMYPIPIEFDSGADEWYEVPDLTVDRAAWHYLAWHTTLALVTDYYWSTNGYEIRAMDFQAGDIYTTIDGFYQDRLFARLLCDRYGRFAARIDRQMQAAGGGTTTFALTTVDWIGDLDFRETVETPVSYVEIGALNYNAGLITPFLSKAPGTVNRLTGSSMQSMNLAIDTQANLNILSGDWIAYLNNQYPEASIPLAGNWRYFDIWPQEYIEVSTVTDRHTFSNDLFIVRDVSFEYEPEDGSLFVALGAELETDGVDGQTVEIPEEIPPWPPPPPLYPPGGPPTPWTPSPGSGRRIISTDIGVFVTDDISSSSPTWYAANLGLSAADELYVWDIKRDAWHWWTTGGVERTLWAATRDGIWKHENFPYGTWTEIVTVAQMEASVGQALDISYARMSFSIEVEDLFAFAIYHNAGVPGTKYFALTVQGGVIQNSAQIGGGSNFTLNTPSIEFAQHSAGQDIYVVRGHIDPFIGYSCYKTSNRGAAWGVVDGPLSTTSKMLQSSLAIPYVDAAWTDDYVYWGYEGRDYRRSVDAGLSFSDFSTGTIYSKIGTGYGQNHVWLLAGEPGANACRWTNDGVTWSDLPFVPAAGGVFGAFAAFGGWVGDQLDELLIGGMHFGDAYVYQWRSGWSDWEDKSGNLRDLGTYTAITQLDRDSMGTA